MGFTEVEAVQPSSERPLEKLPTNGDSVTGILERRRNSEMLGSPVVLWDFARVDARAETTGELCSVIHRPAMNQLGMGDHVGEIVRLTYIGKKQSNKGGREYKAYKLEVHDGETAKAPPLQHRAPDQRGDGDKPANWRGMTDADAPPDTSQNSQR